MINRPAFHKSFVYAYEGIIYTLQTQRMMKFHWCAAIIVMAAALLVRLPLLSALFVLLSIFLIFAAEVMNTAVEEAVDLTTDQIHPIAKIAKDCAAGAVLICGVFAILVGVIVFWEPAILLLQGELPYVDKKLTVQTVAFTFILIILITGLPHLIWGTLNKPVTIHAFVALLFAGATMTGFITSSGVLVGMGYVLAILISTIVIWNRRTLRSAFLGVIVGCVVTLLVAVYYT
ncbi:diacylglycerol kinase family protein [Paenibacillus sp. N1-5-1-14]|uniref:diacylglycerol kinase family protein n=1 Tax=Paenibacillus radicibacter TaxID=2972488 RepID=UPI0021594488|nr:diacylglycerol kinase family protein [Paenibacillus radicibacter]MCR8641973.1 diacylglycerol kinase family protein [Paenibacillus radicibacter]